MPLFRLNDRIVFPDTRHAEPDGLLAIGGDLSPSRLLTAYSLGIFPWYNPGGPILWWTPSPRLVIRPAEFRVPRRLSRDFRANNLRVTMDRAFAGVIGSCAAIPRRQGAGTWINREMVSAYIRLHEMGFAHSVECWLDNELVGGLYGVSLGKIFFGESMFSRLANSSKVALAVLAYQLKEWDFALLDCQVKTAHLLQFGAFEMTRELFEETLRQNIADKEIRPGIWSLQVSPDRALRR